MVLKKRLILSEWIDYRAIIALKEISIQQKDKKHPYSDKLKGKEEILSLKVLYKYLCPLSLNLEKAGFFQLLSNLRLSAGR